MRNGKKIEIKNGPTNKQEETRKVGKKKELRKEK